MKGIFAEEVQLFSSSKTQPHVIRPAAIVNMVMVQRISRSATFKVVRHPPVSKGRHLDTLIRYGHLDSEGSVAIL